MAAKKVVSTVKLTACELLADADLLDHTPEVTGATDYFFLDDEVAEKGCQTEPWPGDNQGEGAVLKALTALAMQRLRAHAECSALVAKLLGGKVQQAGEQDPRAEPRQDQAYDRQQASNLFGQQEDKAV